MQFMVCEKIIENCWADFCCGQKGASQYPIVNTLPITQLPVFVFYFSAAEQDEVKKQRRRITEFKHDSE
jgi:hypothetical protein